MWLYFSEYYWFTCLKIPFSWIIVTIGSLEIKKKDKFLFILQLLAILLSIEAKTLAILCWVSKLGTLSIREFKTLCYTLCLPEDPTIDFIAIFLNSGDVAK